jgi:tellurite resistance protein
MFPGTSYRSLKPQDEESSSGDSYSSDESENSEDYHSPSSKLSPHSDEAVIAALGSFVAECEGASLFTKEEASALNSLLNDEERGCDAVVRAAYLVCYASGRDAQLLYAVLKDVAGKQLSAEGREEHIAQEELVDMVSFAVFNAIE